MSTQQEQEEALALRRELGDAMPSSLRMPLWAVQEGSEVPGTAEDVLAMARHAARRPREEGPQ